MVRGLTKKGKRKIEGVPKGGENEREIEGGATRTCIGGPLGKITEKRRQAGKTWKKKNEGRS